MSFKKLSPQAMTLIFIILLFTTSLCLRVLLPYDAIFGGEWIKYSGIDAYYQMRLVDNLVYNFPDLMNFDPYFVYPSISGVGSVHFFNWFLAAIIWVVSLGSPTQQVIDVIGVLAPAVLGALVVIPVYFIGRALFNNWTGILAAGLIAISPGEFMGRSILGFTDQHVVESLLTAVVMLFLILAIKSSRERGISIYKPKSRTFRVIARPLLYSCLAGLFLGLYLISWLGGLLFVFLITAYFVIQFIIDHFTGKSTDYLLIVGTPLFLVTALISLPVAPLTHYVISVLVALFIPILLHLISVLIAGRSLKPVFFPVALLGVAAVGLFLFYIVNPSALRFMLGLFSIFAPTGASATTTLEAQPIFFPSGVFSWAVVWGNFTINFFLAVIAIGILIFIVIRQYKKGESIPEVILFLTWSLLMLIATLSQRRFAYYFAVNVSLLSGYLAWQAIWFSGLSKFNTREKEIPQKANWKRRAKIAPGADKTPAIYLVNTILAIIVVFFAVYFFNIPRAVSVASSVHFAPSDAWMSSLTWIRENTPAPFADPAHYYSKYEDVAKARSYDYPDSAYGVTSWWDYGYWITRIAQRLPSVNPSQDPVRIPKVANLLLSQEDSAPREILEELDSTYTVIDYQMADKKFWAIVTWSGQDLTRFFDVYYVPYEGKLVNTIVYYPEYYRTLSSRLYNFDNKGVTSESPIVITYEEKFTSDGTAYKQMSDVQEFDSYDKAQDYIAKQESGNHVIAGASPFISPVRLEPVKGYKLIHSSRETISHRDVGQISEVKVFEYTGE